MFQAIEEGEKSAIAFFNKWTEDVRATVPEDQLLVFQVKDGWEPLCRFLNLPVPDEPFPKVNDARGLQEMIRMTNAIAWFVVACTTFGFNDNTVKPV